MRGTGTKLIINQACKYWKNILPLVWRKRLTSSATYLYKQIYCVRHDSEAVYKYTPPILRKCSNTLKTWVGPWGRLAGLPVRLRLQELASNPPIMFYKQLSQDGLKFIHTISFSIHGFPGLFKDRTPSYTFIAPRNLSNISLDPVEDIGLLDPFPPLLTHL